MGSPMKTPDYYAIVATRRETMADGTEVWRQVPTFYLDPNVQGIVSAEHACRIAHDILGTTSGVDASIWAEAVRLPIGESL